MKAYIFIILVFFFCNTIKAQGIEQKVKVICVDSTESFYFIVGVLQKRPKHKIVIVSKRAFKNDNCNSIKVKNVYKLKLENYLIDEEISRLPIKPPSTFLLREEGYIIWDGKSQLPYQSPNLYGLCHINTQPRSTDK